MSTLAGRRGLGTLPVGALRRRTAAAALVVAAGAHLGAVSHHAQESLWTGAAFLLVAAVQMATAGGVLLRWRRASTWAAATSLALVAVWAVSRTVGLPFGAHGGSPEAIGVLDACAVAAELVAVAALMRSGARARRVLLPVGVVLTVAVGVVATAAPGTRAPEPAHAGVHSH